MTDAAKPMIKMPEGVDLTINVYLTSDSEDLDFVFAVKGLTALTEFKEDLSPQGLWNSFNQGEMSPVEDLRVMTRAEIADYRQRDEG